LNTFGEPILDIDQLIAPCPLSEVAPKGNVQSALARGAGDNKNGSDIYGFQLLNHSD